MNATASIAPGTKTIAPGTEAIAAEAAMMARERASMAPPTTTVTPHPPQHMRALERANQVRLARAELKRRVAAEELDVAAVILDCPAEAHSMAVADLLMSQRNWGQTRCRKFLSQIPMSEHKTVGSMTDRQRHTLARMLTSAERGRAWRATPFLRDSLMRA